MRKPLIALTPSCDLKNSDLMMRPTYMRAISEAGGIPLILPLESSKDDLLQIIDTFDAFLFTGGPDVQPFYFGEETMAGCGAASELRDTMELALFAKVVETNKPILGICRGIQLMNIALGGTIYQDIPSQFQSKESLAHDQPSGYSIPAHTIDVVENSPLYKIVGEHKIKVNSMHHQAIRDLAPTLALAGTASDGIIEAVYMPDKSYAIGVQWHPEHLWMRDQGAANLFLSFVNAAK